LPLSTTPLPIIAQSYCSQIQVYEDKSVSNWPTTNLVRQAPTTNDAAETFLAGQIITFAKKIGQFQPSDIVGYVYLPSGTTTGIQVEQP
jgi:hypothetical protein